METEARAEDRAGESVAPRASPRNVTCNTLGEALWGFQWNMVLSSTALVVALRHFGAGAPMISSISAVETACGLLPQLIGIYLFRSHKKRKANLIWWHTLAMIPFLPLSAGLIYFQDRLSAEFLRWALLGAFALYTASIGVIAGVWWDWIAHLFPQKTRGKVIGASLAASAISGTLGAQLAAWVIRSMGVPQAFAVLYLLAGVFAWISMLVFCFVHDPAAAAPDIPPPTAKDFVRSFRASFASRNFRRLLAGRFLASLGFCVLPLISAHYASPAGGDLSEAAIVGAGFAMTLGSALSHSTIGWLGDRAGFRIGILMSTLMQSVTLAIALLMPGQLGCILAFAAAGIVGASAFLSQTNLLYETTPHANRVAHITLANFLLAPAGIIGPLIAGALIQYVGDRAIFGASLAISILAFFFLLLFFREPRREKKTEPQTPS